MKQFSWECFDNDFLKAVIYSTETEKEFRPIFDTDEKEDLVCSMNLIAPFPTDKFVRKYRQIIEDLLLYKYEDILNEVFEKLHISGENNVIKYSKLKQRSLSHSLIIVYEFAINKIGGVDVDFSDNIKFKYTLSIDMKKTPAEDIELYDFQNDAVNALRNHFIKEDKSSGMLVMPTGSGKTRTATYFLIKDMISKGYQILWITHRHILIDQAADCFYKFCGLAKLENPDINDYKISCISGEHQSIKSVDKNDNVVVASIQSLCRNQKHLRRITAKNLMIVIDEAHHTFAHSYRSTINYLRKYRPNSKLLGLTATPIRSNEKDSMALLKLFDNNIVYDISLSSLIKDGTLAEPVPIRINTNENFEPYISEDEGRRIKKGDELPESLRTKIANCSARNKIIVEELIKNKDIYGKTLIFALNILHCKLLCDELKKHGIKCDCVYAGKDNNDYIIEQFKKGKILVLVNVNILTEGSDVPNIDTVFLTRPTQSEGLLLQMIGRGMRGVKSHGTEKVNIVDFVDKWTVFNKWLNPQWLLDKELQFDEMKLEEVNTKKVDVQTFSWETIKDVYNSFAAGTAKYNKLISLPVGYYPLIDKDGDDYILLVFEDQISGYKALKQNMDKIKNSNVDINSLINKYFGGFCVKPSEKDISLFIYNFNNFDDAPTIRLFADRKKYDPIYVAKKAKEENCDVINLSKQIYERYSSVKELYSSWEDYAMKVSAAYIYYDSDFAYGQRVEELPIELVPFDRTPCYNLDELVQEVKNDMFDGVYTGISSITWTDKVYKQYYGCYYYRDNRIVINCILNSKSVDREAVKFVIYHEMLHRDYHYHDKYFKEQEHKYPNYEEYENFLYGNMNKFEISEF